MKSLDRCAKLLKQNKPWEGNNMFSNFEKDKEIFTATANVCEAMENDDGTKTSALISGILTSRKNKDGVNNTKKYRKQLALAEKFEAMTSEERQAYLENLEKEIARRSKLADYFDKSFKSDSMEDANLALDSLKTGATLGVCGAILGMSAVAPNEELIGALIGGASGTVIGMYAHLAEQSTRERLNQRKLDRLTEEWVACSIAENTSEMER